MKSSLKPLKLGLAALAFALVAYHLSDAAATDTPSPSMAPRLLEPETVVIRLRPGQTPLVTLTSDILYRVLASEIAAQRGAFGSAGTTLTNLARETGDARLAQRALEFFMAGNNLQGALQAARIWARRSPNDIEASSTELALAAANGQTAGLADALRGRIDASHDKPAALAQAVVVLSRLSDRHAALSILERAISPRVRALPEARMALADAAQAAGDGRRASMEAQMALVAAPSSEEAAQRVLEYGMAVEPDQAIAQARTFLARHPQARRLHLTLVSQLSEAGDDGGALAELRTMAQQTPEDFDLLLLQGQLLYKIEHTAEARRILEQYVEVQQQRNDAAPSGATDAAAAAAEAHIILARIAEDEGRFDDAVAQLSRIDDPSLRYSAQLRQAGLRAEQGRVDDALAIIELAQPQDEEERLSGVLARAQIQRQAERIGAAVATLEAADREAPDVVEIKYELAMLYERQKRYKDMERQFREVITLAPEHAHAYNALGYTWADNNIRLTEAHELIAKALALSPRDPFILDSMGWVKFRLGDLNAAVQYLDQAYSARPEADIAAHLGEALWAQGQRDKAQQLLRSALEAAPDSVTLRNTIKRLGARL